MGGRYQCVDVGNWPARGLVQVLAGMQLGVGLCMRPASSARKPADEPAGPFSNAAFAAASCSASALRPVSSAAKSGTTSRGGSLASVC